MYVHIIWKEEETKSQNFRSLGLYQEFWHLDPCGNRIARTMQSRVLKLSMFTSYGKRKEATYSKGKKSNFKVTGSLQIILTLGSLWAGYRENYAV